MKKPITIIGAGFSGLVSAYYLVRAGYDIEIYESASKSGGLISTVATAEGLVETAANAFLNSILVEELFAAVGVPMLETRTTARRRYIFRNAKCCRWPLGFWSTLRLAKFLILSFFNRKAVRPAAAESIRTWGIRTLGEEAASYLLEPALQGIYAGDPSRMSARLILARAFSARRASKKPRHRGSVAPLNGMGQLIEALEIYLKRQGVKFHFESSYALDRQVTGASPVIIATNPGAAARLLRPIDPARAALLEKVELSPVVTATAFFKTTDLKSKGFGVLIPQVEQRRALGVLKNDFIFENRTSALFSETWIVGGALANLAKPALTELSNSEIADLISKERSVIFGLVERPQAVHVTRWPQGIPHYTLDLEKSLPVLNSPTNNVFLMGNYLGELGLAKILERASKLPGRLAAEGQWL